MVFIGIEIDVKAVNKRGVNDMFNIDKPINQICGKTTVLNMAIEEIAQLSENNE